MLIAFFPYVGFLHIHLVREIWILTAFSVNILGCKCGIKKSGTKIVGGQNADVNEYPWMTLLLFQSKSQSKKLNIS